MKRKSSLYIIYTVAKKIRSILAFVINATVFGNENRLWSALIIVLNNLYNQFCHCCMLQLILE